ncbi:glycoside hydrolase family 16 protein [Rhodopila sp.]|uniref:glycoside hydrolase family 16 protein n=1 Tax=Rhodopila sp. TaxID=2480087 RepID=UPI003D11DE18
MLAKRALVMVVLLPFAVSYSAEEPATEGPIPAGFHQVWSDEFTTLSLRTGGPSYDGLADGTGTWAAPGAWYSDDPRGVAGYGYDWFVDPSFDRWPAGYPRLGQFAITPEGLRIRAEAPSPAMARMLPMAVRDRKMHPWLAGQINSFHAVRIKPPFYFEARAKMPAGVGRPFPAIWLVTGAHKHPGDHARDYEIDVQEGFGDSDRLHATIHWNTSPDTANFPSRDVVNMAAAGDLSAGFNTWGCYVTTKQQVIYFNGKEVGRVVTPETAVADQPFGIILDVSAGLPWKGGGPPSGGPHDMIVRYVRLYGPDGPGPVARP